jgi:hypothetical protein
MMQKKIDPFLLSAKDSAETLNRHCYCKTLNKEELQKQLERDPSLKGIMHTIWETRPHLFSSTIVFISHEMEKQIIKAIEAMERVIAMKPYQTQALTRAPTIAEHAFGPTGACLGFDFHLGEDGPKLIEINTNAGGALLNAALARAQVACCQEMEWVLHPNEKLASIEDNIFDMFMLEWKSQRGDTPLRSIVIIDDNPAEQYLAPEFELFRDLFQKHGVNASVADPSLLTWQDNQLLHAHKPVDMIYNRLTDFYFEDPLHQSIKRAYESGVVVMTPGPHAHALYADKRNLIALSQDGLLASWGVSDSDRKLLTQVVPHTELVKSDRADDLWANRRNLFFKPVAGFGSKATYRGDKLTKKVWGEILKGDFVAQNLVVPSHRLISEDSVLTELKFDVRAYAYAGKVQLMAARIYSGQTTNFRTPGGGFAPVTVTPEVLIE